MTDGRTCGRKDGHNGQHSAPEVLERERLRRKKGPRGPAQRTLDAFDMARKVGATEAARQTGVPNVTISAHARRVGHVLPIFHPRVKGATPAVAEAVELARTIGAAEAMRRTGVPSVSIHGAAKRLGLKLPHYKDGSGINYPFSYSAMHQRCRKQRGVPSTHTCVDCNLPATDWSHSWRRVPPTELLFGGETGESPYSLDVMDFDPRCRSHARTYDHISVRELLRSWLA